MERFLARRKGVASGLVSTGEKLLDYGWYELGAWQGEELVWEPFPYGSRSSRERHALVVRELKRAGFGVERFEVFGFPARGFPVRYVTVLKEGLPLRDLEVADERHPGAVYRLDPLCADRSRWVHAELGLELGVRYFPALEKASLKAIAGWARSAEAARAAHVEGAQLLEGLERVAAALGLGAELEAAWRAFGHARLRRAQELAAEVSRRLAEPAGLVLGLRA